MMAINAPIDVWIFLGSALTQFPVSVACITLKTGVSAPFPAGKKGKYEG